MLKIRIIALVIAVILTLLTIYLLPIVIYWYNHFVEGLSPERKAWFTYAQIALGAIVAIYGFWQWKKKKSIRE